MESLDIMALGRIMLKRIWALILATVICAALGFGCCELIATPKYSSSAKMVTTTGGILKSDEDDLTSNSNQNTITAAKLQISFALLETYTSTLKMLELYNDVALQLDYEDNLNNEYTPSQLRAMTTFSYKDNSLIITMTVTCEDEEDAIIIAQKISDLAPDYLEKKFNQADVLVVENAEFSSRTFPNTGIITVVSGLLGLIISAVIVYFMAINDNTIKNEQNLVELGITVLGVVPDFNESKKGGYYYHG